MIKAADKAVSAGVTENFATGALTIIGRGAETTGLPLTQPSVEVMMQVTASPSPGIKENCGLLFPVAMPLTYHAMDGPEPPFRGVAVTVTGSPGQDG